VYGAVKSNRPEYHLNNLDLADLEIAGIAIAGDFTLVTGNIRHFGRIDGLKVENWLQP